MTPTLLFWAFALVLTLASVAALAVPLLRARPRTAPGDDDASAAIFRDQKRQIDEEFAAGAITAEERDAAHAELVARLSAELGAAEPGKPAAAGRAPWIAAITLVAILPAAALIAYLALGNPSAIDAKPTASHAQDGEILAMVEKLAQRMRDRPDDPQGWLLLGRSWNALKRFPEAAEAYARAAKLVPGDADLLADWADALGMAQGRSLAGKPTEIIAQALAADPKHPKSLALAASAAMERRDDRTAVRYWRALLAELPPGSEEAQGVAATIAQLEGPGAAPRAPAPSASAARPAADAGTPAAASSPKAATPAAAGARITGRVSVAAALAARVPRDATVFVFARAPSGPRVPLAVLRRPARDLPFEFTLDESMAMAPGMSLATVREVVVEARVSATGNATAAPGDLTGGTGPIAPGATGVVVTIDRVVP